MIGPISIVIPTLGDEQLLGQCLECLAVELRARDVGDEVVVVDDTGEGVLREWLEVNAPGTRCVANPVNVGFGRSAFLGAEAGQHPRLFLMNPDVRVRPGCLEALQETLERSEEVWGVAPYVLLNGEEDSAESLPELLVERGIPRIERKDLRVHPGQAHPDHPHGIPVGFALGGAFLVRRAEFLDQPFDPRFEPFYWEDVDLSQTAGHAGRSVLVDPRAVVEHHHRGTLRTHVPMNLVRAAIEKNRWRFAWKHFDREALVENLERLAEGTLEHAIAEEREALIWLALALEEELAGD